jgi:threonine dehydrogenase-like Zn-dependent dehydrogenase
MRALVFDDNLRLETSTDQPQLASDQVLLKMRRAGVCNTDLEIVKGYMGFTGILGHEFVGEVAEGPTGWKGKRVVGEINVACGDCEFCRRGIPSQCSNRTTVGIDRHPGAFADYLALTVRNLHAVPDTVSDDQAVFVEPLAAALQVLSSAHIKSSQRVALIGAGKLGMLVAQVLKLTGCDPQVIVRRERQAQLLKKWGIASDSIDAFAPRSMDVVVDCTGTSEGFSSALEIVKPRGMIVLKSTYFGLPQANLTRVVVDEIRVVGSRCGPFPAALKLLAEGLVDVASLIEARYSIDDAIEAFDHAAKPGVLKVLLDF